ncbi:MAG: low molecular weight protein-tyrosine-phosphatase [Bergeyella zoohelcum]|nr:low molecular weight protein-tyrosine-phosphatase [Bergeyella zoohelcum]
MKILMLCLGNICRSPLAEGILRAKLPADFEIDSAGTAAYHTGEKADHRSIQVAHNHGVDISMHRARQLTEQDFEIFDKIFCMDKSNLQNAMKLAKTEADRDKLSLILGNAEVPDPYYGGIDGFEKVYKMLDDICEKIANELIENQ